MAESLLFRIYNKRMHLKLKYSISTCLNQMQKTVRIDAFNGIINASLRNIQNKKS